MPNSFFTYSILAVLTTLHRPGLMGDTVVSNVQRMCSTFGGPKNRTTSLILPLSGPYSQRTGIGHGFTKQNLLKRAFCKHLLLVIFFRGSEDEFHSGE